MQYKLKCMKKHFYVHFEQTFCTLYANTLFNTNKKYYCVTKFVVGMAKAKEKQNKIVWCIVLFAISNSDCKSKSIANIIFFALIMKSIPFISSSIFSSASLYALFNIVWEKTVESWMYKPQFNINETEEREKVAKVNYSYYTQFNFKWIYNGGHWIKDSKWYNEIMMMIKNVVDKIIVIIVE